MLASAYNKVLLQTFAMYAHSLVLAFKVKVNPKLTVQSRADMIKCL
jgi:hypothetical protein